MLELYEQEYITYLQAKGLQENTIINKQKRIKFFIEWLGKHEGVSLTDVSKKTLESYHYFLMSYEHPRTKSILCVDVQRRYLQAIKDFYSFAINNNYISQNPAEKIKLPKINQSLPSQILSREKIEEAIANIKLRTIIDIRNRALIELIFASGVRTAEIANLKLNHIDFDRCRLIIRESKGLKDRVLPLSTRCIFWLKYYLRESREKLLKKKECNYYFVSSYAKQMCHSAIRVAIKNILQKVDVDGHIQLLRHSYATMLLDRGMNIRFIQELLGHSKLETTEIYTRVSIGKLKEVHKKTHPREKS